MLRWNTRELLGIESNAEPTERTTVEYHFLSGRELYDKSILTVDRHSSGAAQWVIQCGSTKGFYTVTVVSRPYYSLPQELCLTFDCFTHTATKGNSVTIGPPVDRVVLELLALLSVFAREPLIPLGLRRIINIPIAKIPHYHYPPKYDRASTPPAYGFNSPEFIKLMKGFARAPEDLTQAILAAAKFYRSGLSLIGFDPSIAYTSFVSAIECLSGYHYYDKSFEFEKVDKFHGVRPILERICELANAKNLVADLKEELLRLEHFLRKKFISFFVEFVTDEFWNVPDDLYHYGSIFPEITRESFEPCLKRIYDARSRFVHVGTPFPLYVEVGLRSECPVDVIQEIADLKNKCRFVPPLAWYERLTQSVIIEYIQRFLVPELIESHKERLVEKDRLLKVIGGLPTNVQDSLSQLIHWTARFLPFAVMNPHAPNKEWADCDKTVSILKKEFIIDGEGESLEGSSWLKNRVVGEIVGEFVFGTEENPFRGNVLLLPKDYNSSETD